jgi:hypothetical protein
MRKDESNQLLFDDAQQLKFNDSIASLKSALELRYVQRLSIWVYVHSPIGSQNLQIIGFWYMIIIFKSLVYNKVIRKVRRLRVREPSVSS